MANARMNVAAPVKSKLGYGLDSVAEIRAASADGGRWRAGVTWQNVCPDAGATYDQCVLSNAVTEDMDTPPAKSATADRSAWGATPFTVVVEIDCSPPGFWDDADEIVARTFTEAEAYQVEQAFWSGAVITGTGHQVFPHLVSNAGVVDSEGITLQLVAAPVVTGGPFDPVEALGMLESSLATCVKGQATIHMPVELLASFAANHLVEARDGVLYTILGNKISVSAAYTGEAPDGTLTAGTLWMYGTGPVFMYRSSGSFIGTKAQSLDRSVDTLKRLYERTYVIGYDCCLFGVPVSTGGVVSGVTGSSL